MKTKCEGCGAEHDEREMMICPHCGQPEVPDL